jgi:hypothetical protein
MAEKRKRNRDGRNFAEGDGVKKGRVPLATQLRTNKELSLTAANLLSSPALMYHRRTHVILRIAYTPSSSEVVDPSRCSAPISSTRPPPELVDVFFRVRDVRGVLQCSIEMLRMSGAALTWVHVPLVGALHASTPLVHTRMLFVPDGDGGCEGWLVSKERWDGTLPIAVSPLLLGPDLKAVLAQQPGLSLQAYNAGPFIARGDAPCVVLRTAATPVSGSTVNPVDCTHPFLCTPKTMEVPDVILPAFHVSNPRRTVAHSYAAVTLAGSAPVPVLVPLGFSEDVLGEKGKPEASRSQMLFIPDSTSGDFPGGWVITQKCIDSLQNHSTVLSTVAAAASGVDPIMAPSSKGETSTGARRAATGRAAPADSASELVNSSQRDATDQDAIDPRDILDAASAHLATFASTTQIDQRLTSITLLRKKAAHRLERISLQELRLKNEQQRLTQEQTRLAAELIRATDAATALDTAKSRLQARRAFVSAEDERVLLEEEVRAAREKLQAAEEALARSAVAAARAAAAFPAVLLPPASHGLVTSELTPALHSAVMTLLPSSDSPGDLNAAAGASGASASGTTGSVFTGIYQEDEEGFAYEGDGEGPEGADAQAIT